LIDANGYAHPARCGEAMEQYVPDRATQVLDLGCGTGLVGSVLDGLGYDSITGCDYSPEMLAEAHKTGVYDSLIEVDLNEHPLPFGANEFGAICAIGIFSFGHVHATLINEMVRLLPADGTFVIGVNELWWAEGSLHGKLDSLEDAGEIDILLCELGEGVPSHDVDGWVVVARVTPGAGGSRDHQSSSE
ncbi:MAG: class I SAM-dependent DNA methyltransferase, partial [Acidimicrobiales bacterium]